ncbi:signal transduction histidine kinase [Phytophthora cinnamomi]|uniref:signal transduction histidine kinase n=1 Tax=Phytophthora cinnamomi TaxID=4785 RepID=UPI00355A8FC7|nr:signal transduction histidine kinase [Phytophthora cinnamomi]
MVLCSALIVADSKPRTVPSRQRSQLKDLAEQVSALLEDLWTRTRARQLASSQTGQLRDQLVDLLAVVHHRPADAAERAPRSRSNPRPTCRRPCTTADSSNASSSAHQPQYAKDFRHMQSVEL